jgi:hypothetical protein
MDREARSQELSSLLPRKNRPAQLKKRWPNHVTSKDDSVGVCIGVELRLERLVVLALDLDFGLKLLDLKLEARDFSAEFGEVGTDWA